VLGYGSDKNIYVLDIVRDRLNLTERAELLFRKHRRFKPMQSNGVRYEKYGLMADIEHIRGKMSSEAYHFNITEVAGQTSKNDRIRRLIPWFEQGRILFPRSLNYTQYDGRTVDLIHEFIEQEYVAFPVSIHDDMLDALARIVEPDYPMHEPTLSKPVEVETYYHGDSSWMG
jgi:predicted phage terminase large subunit-like protein